MKFSILTATIGRSTLLQLHESILSQSYTNWEWIIVLDGEKAHDLFKKNGCDKILSTSRNLNRVQLHVHTGKYHAFGREQRRFAFGKSKGDFIIYIDDDDLLAHNCLSTVNPYTKNHDLILWKVKSDWLKADLPRFTTNIHQIACGDICSNGYAVRTDIVVKCPYPETQKRVPKPGIANDFYWFMQIRKIAKTPILIQKVLAYAIHNYDERNKTPEWASKFGH